MLGQRDAGTDLLTHAVEAYRLSLDGTDKDRYPLEWADTQNDLDRLLQQAYRSKRQEEFGRLVRLWSPLLPIGFIAFQAFTLVFYTAGLLAVNQVYITLMVLLIGMLGLQLSIRAGIRGCLLGAVPFLTLPWISDIHYGLLFLGHYLLTVTVALFVVAVREDKDRMMFLQSMRFQQERQEVQRLNAELADMARKDVLTGLANRRVFDEAARAEWDRARRNRASMALYEAKSIGRHRFVTRARECMNALAYGMAYGLLSQPSTGAH